MSQNQNQTESKYKYHLQCMGFGTLLTAIAAGLFIGAIKIKEHDDGLMEASKYTLAAASILIVIPSGFLWIDAKSKSEG